MTPFARPCHRWMLALLAALWLNAPPSGAAQALMTWADLTRAPAPKATRRIPYGRAANQVIDLWLPEGPGPHPVVVMLHGGCWRASVANLGIMNYIAEDLRRRGLAVWNIEYRGVDQPGGGYPGTFQDVRSAVGLLEAQAEARRLDTHRLVVVGHSAGAVLSLWLAGRGRLPSSSPLHEASPLQIHEVVALGGFADFRTFAKNLKARCGVATEQVTGPPTAAHPDVYADTNPLDLTPSGSETTFINGDHDEIVTPADSADSAARMRARGDATQTIVLPAASHFDEVAVTSPSWRLVAPAILKALGIR